MPTDHNKCSNVYHIGRRTGMGLETLQHNNAKGTSNTHERKDKTSLRKEEENKDETPYKGPFSILQVNNNGTVRLKMGAVEDTINI